MAFDTVERSVSDGRPVELYDFNFESTHFRFTNSDRAVSALGFTWTPGTIFRDNIDQSSEEITGQVELLFGYEDLNLKDFCQSFVAGPPETNTFLTIYKLHQGDGAVVTFFAGELRSVAFRPGIAVFLASNVTSYFTDRGPRMNWGSQCNHIFGDELCTFVVTTVTRNLPVALVAADGITVTITGLSTGHVDGDYVRGELRLGGIARRYIARHVGNVITMLYPLPGLEAGDLVDVVEGCPHTVAACNTRFGNVVNYGGTPYTPIINPFEHGLDNT